MPSQALGHICRNLHGFSLLHVNTEEGRERSGMAEEEAVGRLLAFQHLIPRERAWWGLFVFWF